MRAKTAPIFLVCFALLPGAAWADAPAAEQGSPPAADEVPAEQRECLARTIYFEARGESMRGQKAVAHVVLNRVEDPEFPDTICDVVQQGGETPPCQFSWYCDGRSDRPSDMEAWMFALELSDQVLAGELPDVTQGATYFHHVRVNPDWREVFERTARVGPHLFYRPPDESGEQVAEVQEEATADGQGSVADDAR